MTGRLFKDTLGQYPWLPVWLLLWTVMALPVMGGDWPGSPDNTTIFPQDMEVDYVRVYKKQNN